MQQTNATGATTTQRQTPWQMLITYRWERLQSLIAEQEALLARGTDYLTQKEIEARLKTLKRAAMSVWGDARAAGIVLKTDVPTQPRGPEVFSN